MSATPPPTPVGPETRFSFLQIEVPRTLGPPDGRYLVRGPGDTGVTSADVDAAAGGAATHVIVLTTLGAPERQSRLAARRSRRRAVDPEPDPVPVLITRATVIDTVSPFPEQAGAEEWLRGAGENELRAGLAVLNEVLLTYRAVAADPYTIAVGREDCSAARVGFGAGAQVAESQWTDARELGAGPADRTRRRRVAPAHARLAAVLAGREQVLACEELILRARSDLAQRRPREAALQLLVALDAAVAELGSGPDAAVLAARLTDLRGRREAVAQAAQAALGGEPSAEQQAVVEAAVGAVEAALRARPAGG